MIFTTKNKELAIFGRTLTETKGKLIDFFETFERGGIRGQDGIIDTFFSKNQKSPLTPELLETFELFKDEFNSTSLSVDVLKEKFGDVDQRIIAYAKTCKNGEMTTEGFKASINNMSLSAKAGSAALKALSIAGNMIAMWAITKGIQLVVQGIDNLIHRVEKARERTDELFNEFKEMNDTLADHKKTVAELADRYDELSKKVNLSSNANVSLSTDEYEEFLNINERLAKSFPELIKGIDENGNSILTLGTKGITAKEQLEELLQTEEDLNNFRIAQGLGDAFKGVYTYVEDANEATEQLNSFRNGTNEQLGALQDYIRNGAKLEKDNYLLFKGDITDTAKTNYVYAMQSAAREFLDLLDDNRRMELYSKGLDVNGLFTMNTDELTGAFDFYADLYELTPNEIKKLEGLISDNVATLNGSLTDQFSDQEQELQECIQQGENAWRDFIPNLVAGMKSKQTFKDLVDSDLQDIVVQIVEGLDYSYAYAMNEWNPTDPYAYIRDNLVVPMGKLSDDDKQLIKDSFTELMTLDAEDISQSNQAEITKLIGTIADLLKKEPLEIRFALGFDVEDSQKRYNEALKEAKRQLGGYGHDDRGFELNNAVGYSLDDFWSKNVTTEEDLVLWGKATEGITDAVRAMEIYTEAKKNAADVDEPPISFSGIFSLKDAEETLTNLGQLSESIDTIQNAYKTLYDAIDEYNKNGAFSVDTLQTVIALGDDWLDYLVDADGALKLDKESLEQLTQARLNDMRVQAINNIIDNVSKINDDASANEYLTTTNYALADSYDEVAQKALESARAQMEVAVAKGTLSQENMDAAMNKATADINKINKLFANTSIDAYSIMGGGGSGGSSSKSEFSETIDFFERRVEVLDDALSHLKSSLDNVTGSFAKNNLIDAELGITEEKFNNYTDALAMYTQKANEAFSKIPADIASTVKDGAVSLTDFIGNSNEDVVEAIKEYESWTDTITDCTQELEELKTTIRQLELEKFNNIMDDFSNQFDLRGDSKDLISKQIDLLKEAGELIGESFYTSQIDQSKKQLELLENEKAQLVNQLSNAINSGRIQAGTEEWLEMVNALSDVDGSILDCKKSIEGFDNSLLELHTEIFNRIQEQFSNLDSEISNILDLFDEFEVSDDKGIWSKEGIAQLGLLAQQYELAQYQVQQYNNEIDELNKQYLAGRYSATEYADKLADLSSAQWDAAKSTESAKDSIMELNETRIENQIKGIEKEIDAYKELTDAQIDALKTSKDLHDYENSIAEKTKSITDMERQIAAMQNDTSAATVAKKKKLEEQLAEARKDLEETEYDHSIEVQEDTLNKQYENYEKERNEEIDALRESLNDKETILAESFETVKGNASVVGQEIATIATEHGITVSDALISSWQSGENAIASYGKVLSQSTSAFIQNIMGVENEVWNLQAQANTTADSLAWMFSAKADNLVNELYMSYYAETTLADMTNALQQSLVNTLERGYDASSIVNSLNSITAAAEKAKRALSDLNNPTTPADTPDAQSLLTKDVGKNVGKSQNDLKQQNQQYQLIDKTTGRIWKDNLSYEETLEYKKDHITDINTILVKKYASGTRNAKDGLRVINETGPELVLPKLSSGNYTVGNAGDQILTKVETDNIFGWAKLNPDNLIPVNITDYLDNLKTMSMPQILPSNVNNNNNPVQIGNLINVQGSVNSSDLKQMESIANKAVDKLVNKIHDRIMYGT